MSEPSVPTGSQNPGPSGQQDDKDAGQQLDANAIARMVNAAVTDHLKRAIPKAIESALPTLIEGVAKHMTQTQPPKDGKSEPDHPKQPDPEVVALKKQLEEMRGVVTKEQEARETAERKRRDDKAYADLRGALSSGNVRTELVDALAKVLFVADKRVEFDEQDNPLIRVRVSMGKGLPEEDQLFPLTEGVKHFLKTKEAEPYLPPPGGAGGGAGQPRSPGAQAQRGGIPRYDQPAMSEDEKARRTLEQMNSLGVKF